MAHILIAENDTNLLPLISRKLGGAGHKVTQAENGGVALDLMKAEKPDLVLLDVDMPTKDGVEVIKTMQADPTLKTIPVVVITNSRDVTDMHYFQSLGASDFLIKAEFNLEQILEKIQPYIMQETTPQTQTGGSTVLIIEDDQFLREILFRELNKDGFHAEAAIDGAKALEILGQKSISLILLDLLLPGIDGYQILENLKKDERYKNIPIVILSNLGEPTDREKALKLGATDYLIKAHYTTDEIVKRIREILSGGSS